MTDERLPLVTIMGPTGVGKTDLAISLAKLVSSEIISVDSVQVYKGMDIGSGKASKDIGAVNPKIYAFGNDAYSILDEHLGSKFYIRKLEHYSHYTGKEKYRELVLDVIGD